MNCKLTIVCFLCVLTFYAGTALSAKKESPPDVLKQHFESKYYVIQRAGLYMAICTNGVNEYPYLPYFDHDIRPSGLEVKPPGAFASMLSAKCEDVSREPLHLGEIMTCGGSRLRGDTFTFNLYTVSKHQITRRFGNSLEDGLVRVHFKLPNRNDTTEAIEFIEQWIKPFDSLTNAEIAAATFGNTASGAFVKEINLGMTPAQVEAILGPPEAKINLGERMIYKYKDMTIEFRDGKVSDVK